MIVSSIVPASLFLLLLFSFRKRVRGESYDGIRDNIKKISDKFVEPTKLPPNYYDNYEKHLGYLKIDNPSHPCYNMNEETLKNILLNGNDEFYKIVGPSSTGQIPVEKLSEIQELRIINNVADFIIYGDEWQ